ncbi:ABC transporter ATP-binding protein [uncultured Eubacterium sp.]|uniref:ABC transporter ATP-binding protein n=1 Tax=uncultured Eubacterium sp. TaxID=165185 RepID=UPI0025995F44|nr:ABC transporter ATP-binding protein [uncultured Eubacterium sp.]
MSLLEVNHIDVHYGDFLALKDVSINVEPGTIVSLIGANGAGKSTIMNTICGLNKPTKGDIIFDGQNIAGKKPNQIARLGLSMAPEGSHCFERMTVQDNLLMGAYLAKKDERMQRLENVYKLFPILKEKANQMSTFLSGGQRQMLAIGRGIMTQPKILLCDEISLGLAPVVINDIYEKLKEIADTGLTMLIVEQDVNRSLKSSDYAYVVLEGKIVMQGKSKELSVDEVNDAYFGINTFSH